MGPGRRSTPGATSEEERDRIADTLRLAQALGGEPVTIPGGDRRIADDVVGFAQANNVTQIVIGKSTRSSWFELLHGSVVRDLLRCCGTISVHVIAGEELSKETIPRKTVRTADRPEPLDWALFYLMTFQSESDQPLFYRSQFMSTRPSRADFPLQGYLNLSQWELQRSEFSRRVDVSNASADLCF